jgi:hypothetical protein
LIGSIPSVLLGSQLTVRLPDRSLRVALALGLSGVKLLEPPGANVIVISIVAVALLVGGALAVRRLATGRVAAAVQRGR